MRVTKALLTFGLCLAATPAFAWGEDGHAAIAEVAYHQLNTGPLAVVNRLLKIAPDSTNTISLASIGSWADDYRANNKNTSNWHFIDIPFGQDANTVDKTLKYDAARDCGDDPGYGTCLLKALPAQEAILKDITKTDAERAQALYFVVHLVGDLSQPLHCVDRYQSLPVAGQRKPMDDLGGNAVIVSFNISRPAPDSSTYRDLTNLHMFWDTDILLYKHYDWGQISRDLESTIIPHLDPTLLADNTEEAWANQCHGVGQDVYAALPPKTKLTSDLSHAVILDQAYFDKFEPIAMQQLALGAVHLAKVLNDDLAGGK